MYICKQNSLNRIIYKNCDCGVLAYKRMVRTDTKCMPKNLSQATRSAK